ncbi:MAG: diacylglycerol kinase family lipid kinase [Anaerolineales bacterium]|nr:diacylglycerol kinase family lipid kinase [Anaerolineales bacterium]
MRWIPVIINPSAGKKTAVLAELNEVFQPAGVRWSVEITQGDGDGARLASRLVEQGAEIVGVYGGDGTVSEVATGLAGSDTALGVLPGGTGNVLAYDFGVPRDFVEAARLLVSEHAVRTVDMGEIGERKFLLRVGVGFEALVVEHTPRSLKDRFGLLAYGIGGLQALLETRALRYQLDLDGQAIEAEGVICTVANSGHLGLPGMTLSPSIDIADGLLDVFVLRKVDIRLLIQIVSENIPYVPKPAQLQQWQVREVGISVAPSQTVQVDGDNLGTTPVRLRSAPGCLKVIVPGNSV